MYRKTTYSWIKHWDFEIIDILCMEVAFFVAHIVRHRDIWQDMSELYMKKSLDLFIVSLLVMFFHQNYKGILVRNKWQEITATVQHVTIVQLLFLVYEYFIKEAELISRWVFFASWILSCGICYFARVLWKRQVRARIEAERSQNKMMVITSAEKKDACINSLYEKRYREFEIACIAIPEENIECENFDENLPIIVGKDNIIEYVRQKVVDEVFIDFIWEEAELEEWKELFINMGITVHINLGFIPENLPNRFIEKMGTFYVVTSSIKIAESWELVCKRLLDILGGAVGLMLTGVTYLFVAPAIKHASPGPVFFKQARVGKNGRIFYIYKFRSMYMDAEERKQELMKYNEMNGLMFKMENDPRIIGSEKGPGKGIGNFIRKTSIDELPQFWNILKGDMSLVGTRPPTVNEYENYKLHHKIRLSAKPGLTGMWQVSGRNNITDFEEVVKLDMEYIENWNLKLDIIIILKTIKVVFDRTGSK